MIDINNVIKSREYQQRQQRRQSEENYRRNEPRQEYHHQIRAIMMKMLTVTITIVTLDVNNY